MVGIYFVMQRVAGKGQVKVGFTWFKVFQVLLQNNRLLKKTLNGIILAFLLDPDCWCRMGFCRFSTHEGNISMGWSKRN